MSTGPATIEMLQELHRLLALDMIEALSGTPTADLLAVTRSFLRDNGLAGQAQTDRDRKQLQRLYALYCRKLAEALDVEHPSASVLGEVRVFLQQQGIGKDLGGLIEKARAVEVLSMTSLPFKTPVQ